MWHIIKNVRSLLKTHWRVAVLIGLGVALGGVYLSGRLAERSVVEQTGGPSVAAAVVGEAGGVAIFETFQIAIPDGWERVPEREGGDGGVLLYLRGPMTGDQHLVVAAEVYPVAKGVTLSGFAGSYTAEWPIESFPVDREVKLCGQAARIVGFTNADGDNLVLFCVHQQQAYVIVMIAPAETMPEHAEFFHKVLAGLQLYE